MKNVEISFPLIFKFIKEFKTSSILIVFGILSLFYFYITFQEINKEIDKNQIDINRLVMLKNENNKYLEEIEKLKKENESLFKTIVTFKNFFYTNSNIDDFANILNSYILSNNITTLEIVKKDGETIKDKSGKINLYNSIEFNLKLQSNYIDYINFIREISDLNQYVYIKTQDIIKKDEEGNVIVNLDLIIYKIIETNNKKD